MSRKKNRCRACGSKIKMMCQKGTGFCCSRCERGKVRKP